MATRSRTANLTHGIVHDLGVAIVTGAYDAAGGFPVEAELCRRYGVSRTALREAVKMLTAKGLLASRPRHGTSIQPETRWNLLDPDVLEWLLQRRSTPDLLLEFANARLGFEPAAAALAARVASSEARRSVRDAISRMEAAARGEQDFLEADIAFHMAVLEASGNRFFMKLRELSAAALRTSIRTTDRYKGVPRGSVADHKRIADAICDGDADLAYQTTRELIQETIDLILAQRRRTGRRTNATKR